MKPAHNPDIHQARVYLAQARVRRHQPDFHATLLQWAANARRRAMAQRNSQTELFA